MTRTPISGGIETITYFYKPEPWMVLDPSTNPDDSLDQEAREFRTRAEADAYRAKSGGALYKRDVITRVTIGVWECQEWMVADYA